jgi:hypothetical protein
MPFAFMPCCLVPLLPRSLGTSQPVFLDPLCLYALLPRSLAASFSRTPRCLALVSRHSRLTIHDLFCNFGIPLKTSELIMGVWRQLQEYFYLKKRDPNAPNTSWMRYMHGINRISLFMFLLAIIIIIVKLILMRK